MYDVPGMNEGDSLADLTREAHARLLRQHELVTDRTLEQLTAVHAAQQRNRRQQTSSPARCCPIVDQLEYTTRCQCNFRKPVAEIARNRAVD